MIEIGTALSDARVFEPWFHGASWDGWKAVLRAAFGERMTKAERDFFFSVAKRQPPGHRVKELLVVSGRRSGKDSVASAVAAHVAANFDPAGRLRPGERAVVMLLAVDREQAQTVLGYIRSYFERIPALAAMVEHETSDGFELKNSVDISIVTNDHRSTRGRTVLCCVMDELSYWRSETSMSPDKEVYRAIRPGMLTLPEAMMISITTAYRRAGLAYDQWAKHFGRDGSKVLVIHAESTQLNPLLPQSEIDDALAEDAEAARADYLSQWRDDLSTYIGRDLVEGAVDHGVLVRPPDLRRHRYMSFIDASSGKKDSFAAAIAHMEGQVAVLDCLIEMKSPCNVAEAVAQIVPVLRSYGLTSTMGDSYAIGFVIAELQRHRFGFQPRPTGMDRSVLYLTTAPLFNAGRVRLIDNKRLVGQYAALEARLLPGGHTRVAHPPGHHDDLSNVCAGVLWRCALGVQPLNITNETLAELRSYPKYRGVHSAYNLEGQTFRGPIWEIGTSAERQFYQMQRANRGGRRF